MIPEEFLVEYVVDRVETTSTVWLGLTTGCARCHDHKYDPLTQKDFYRLFDFFNRVPEPGKAKRDMNSPPVVRAPTPDQEARLAALAAEARAARAAWDDLRDEVEAVEASWVAEEAGTDGSAADDFTVTSGLMVRLPLERGPEAGEPVALEDVPAFDTEHAFSAAVRLRPESDEGESTVYASWDTAALDQGIQFVLARGRPQVVIAARVLDDVLRVEAERPLPCERWSHVTWTYDGSRLAAGVQIHVDGEPVPLRVVNDELNSQFTCKQPLTLGGGGTAGAFRGGIADLRFYDRVLAPHEAAVVACTTPIAEIVRERRAGRGEAAAAIKLREYFLAHAAPERLRAARDRSFATQRAVTAFERSLPTTMVMQDVPGLRPTHVLARGEYDKPGERVTAGVPEAFDLPLPEAAAADRLALARWLVDRRHPLTARVFVNRIWQQLFGIGLVKTVEDFGLQGETPPHRELLDWLAVDFIESGWDIKRLLRQIVTTAAYRRSSRAAADAIARDPDNRLLARGPRFRLSAEVIRDATLAASGLLVERLGGPSVKPYQPPGLWEELAAGATPYEQDHGESLYRRSLYVYRKRTVAVPIFATFDAAARETCQVRQSRTNTPLQALALLNDVAFVEAARNLGARMIREGGSSPTSRIAHGFRLATARAPRPRELEVLVDGFTRRRDEFARNPAAAKALLAHGESPVDATIAPEELAAYATVGNVLLNLDEFLTRE